MKNTEVKSCDCTGVFLFLAGGGVRTARPMVTVPFHTREAGAKFQDELYGKGMRLHNIDAKKKTAGCTVCGKVKHL